MNGAATSTEPSGPARSEARVSISSFAAAVSVPSAASSMEDLGLQVPVRNTIPTYLIHGVHQAKTCLERTHLKLTNSPGSRGYSPMFGGGVYSTSVSSKADNYAMNHRIHSHLHSIILCLVFIGKYEKLHQAEQ